jgi:hypothetical protein
MGGSASGHDPLRHLAAGISDLRVIEREIARIDKRVGL